MSSSGRTPVYPPEDVARTGRLLDLFRIIERMTPIDGHAELNEPEEDRVLRLLLIGIAKDIQDLEGEIYELRRAANEDRR